MLAALSRVFFTLLVVVAAAVAAFFAWRAYVEQPWTRDGRVRANVLALAPDVSGPVVDVRAKDNQRVRKGDVLFVIDPARYRFALAQAEATAQGRESDRDQKKREFDRRSRLTTGAITEEAREQAAAALAAAEAAYGAALAELDVARLNLDRTEVRSPVNGFVTNLQIHPGDYASAGKALAALVDEDSFYVAGYFEETKIARIHDGDPATIRLMGFEPEIRGRVESVSRAIADREITHGSDLVLNVNPTFNWVRLAQRIPVRIAIENVPKEIALSAGMTATVVVGGQGQKTWPDWWPRFARWPAT
ncbi:efflux transporter periplasmic adaptor subunit [Alsobacter soli]|uniref:Efflux transporter periplasmic adaptor subunit n=1 Tax=Alsobacter soli TaxID=2109933 RepID=A0A2T1HVN4_9HYPH|nr:HlyD family secretion protein [Alsobacter soli]PSC05717.1 efflux transporter periplasmic adaptor subunit [Alsobacter soli]